MNRKFGTRKAAPLSASFAVLALALAAGLAADGCGMAIPLTNQGVIGSAVLIGTGGSRTDGSDIGDIYPVTTVVPATAANPYPTVAELPFAGQVAYPGTGAVSSSSTGAVTLGQACTDGQTYFYFQYAYPSNNYKLGNAHLVLDVKRDPSDTEGIFVAGALSGSPPLSMINTASPHIQYPLYLGYTGPTGSWYTGPGSYTPNTYYNDWAVSHYKIGAVNTFDLDMANLLNYTNVAPADLVKTGMLPVMTGDDSEVDQGFLVLNGYTISKTPLTCHNSATYTYTNDFVHDDGDSIGQAAFTGPVAGPYGSWATTGPYSSVEWYYDEALPRVPVANVTAATGKITMTVKRNTATSPYAAIVINGYGVSEPGFDRSAATSAVETWDSGSATSYWQSWVAAIPSNGTATAVTLDLVAMLGQSKLLSLLSQGKLNIAVSGSIVAVSGGDYTANRAKGHAVAGPELLLSGTYFTQLCDIPDDPNSPLNDNDPAPSQTGDHTSPLVSSLGATQITSSSAVVQWLTNEPATSQVGYGVGNTSTLTTEDPTLTTFHQVQLTGLQAYRVYTFQAYTADGAGNLTVSGTAVFQTLR